MADRYYGFFVVVLKESFNQIVFVLNKIQVAPGSASAIWGNGICQFSKAI